MSHKDIAHPIVRNGVYYFNKRLSDKMYRVSLKTKDPYLAMLLSSSISIEFQKYSWGRSMDNEQLDQLVRTVKQEHIKSLSSVLLDKSDDFYMKYRDVFLEKHFASYEVFENSKSTFDYRKRKGKFYDYYKNPQNLAWNVLTSLILNFRTK